MSIRERTIKLVLASLIANLLAHALKLNNPYAAGIVAILTLLDTRTDTLNIAKTRVLATFISFTIAILVFNLIGFSEWSFLVYLICFIPLAYRLGLQVGIAPCSMLVSHFITAQSTGLTYVLNGLGLMLIGSSASLLMLLWMPSQGNQLDLAKRNIDQEIINILSLLSKSVKAGASDNGLIQEKLKQLKGQMKAGQSLAVQEYNNQVFVKTTYQIKYLAMRNRQVQQLQAMSEILPNIPMAVEQGNLVAQLLERTADQYGEDNTGREILEDIAKIYQYIQQTDLPKTRREFEARAMLYAFLVEFNQFVEIKRDFFQENR